MYDEENELDLVPLFSREIIISFCLTFAATFLITAYLI